MNYKQILEDNKDNVELLAELVREVNVWDGSLEAYEVHEFDDDFFNNYFEGDPMESARATFFGEINNWNDEYIRINGYGNFESLTNTQYAKELIGGADEIILQALEAGDEIDLKEILSNNDIELEGA